MPDNVCQGFYILMGFSWTLAGATLLNLRNNQTDWNGERTATHLKA
jgi:hypothetical protein